MYKHVVLLFEKRSGFATGAPLDQLLRNSCTFPDYPSASPPNSWLNSPSTVKGNWRFSDSTNVRTILALGKNGLPDLCFGFYSNGTADAFFLVIMKVPNKVDSTFTTYDFPPVVLWCANRDSPVKENATLMLANDGLMLKDADGTTIWSSGASGLGGIELEFTGNLRLLVSKTVQQCGVVSGTNKHLAPGQRLLPLQDLHSSTSTYNLAVGLFHLKLRNYAVSCYVGSRPPGQKYCSLLANGYHTSFDFGIGSLNRSGTSVTYIARSHDFQYLRLQPNGSLTVFQFLDNKEIFYYDLLNDQLRDPCDYPNVCGKYGVCKNSNCACVGGESGDMSFFEQLNASQANFGCRPINPISCGDIKRHVFVELPNVDYFWSITMISNTDASVCKEMCLRNCSCKAVLFRYHDDSSKGTCSFPSDIFSLMATTTKSYTAVAYVKTQSPSSIKKTKKSSVPLVVLLLSLLAGGIFLSLLGACYFYVVRRNKPAIFVEKGEKSIIDIPPVVQRFSFSDLQTIAEDFQVQLGKGGYGEVFEGTMKDGTKVAIKRLFDKGKTEFVPEVETIGRVHHFNLVKLVGYCAQGSNRLLVYEYLQKGSLDKWIFNRKGEQTLSWEIKWQIILGVAKGLEYLHEHCNPKIIHFDIKPQNILLDEEFNVKIADFGLAKLIDRDQSNVSTMIKGTRGYMAPELIAGRNVSVKVDVYSFGIVILETVTGRRNSDMYCNDQYLIDAVKTKAKEGLLGDLIDDSNEYTKGDKEAALKAIEIGIRCLQPQSIRPRMPVVVKLLEGAINLEPVAEYSFLTVFYDPGSPVVVNRNATTPLIDSVLSGPR